MQKAVKTFIQFLKYEKRYSQHTIISYENDLQQFQRYLQTHYELENILEAHFSFIRSWIVHMIQNKVTAKTVNRKISSLRSFYKFHKKRRTISTNPMQKIIAPKVSKRLPAFIREDKMESLLQTDHFTDDFHGQRDLLLIELLYQTGMRRAELMSLSDSDVNYSTKSIKVMGKGSKERLIPVQDSLLQLIRQYIELRDELFEAIASESLMVTDKGLPLYPKYVYNKVKGYLSMVTTNDKRSPHILRHSFATHIANRGAELNAIKSLLGHASLAATQVYTHNTIEKLKKAHKQAHPKS